jgi:hypothetical protein
VSAWDETTSRRNVDRERHLEFAVFESDTVSGEGHLADVSETGLMMRSSRVPKSGESVEIRFHLADPQPIVLQGRVRWTSVERQSPTPGFGVHIDNPPPAYVEWLQFMRFYRRRGD